MPWLYSGPDDNVCKLRGVGEDDDAAAAGAQGAARAAPPEGRFWDGSRDRWVAVVSTRVEPDVVRVPAPAAAREGTWAAAGGEGRRSCGEAGPGRLTGCIPAAGDKPARAAAAA